MINFNFRKNQFHQIAPALISLVFLAVLFVPTYVHAEKIYEVLSPASTSGPSQTVRDVWTQLRNMINYLVMAFLIYVAFLNILRVQTNTYSIKKILPALIFGVILANFSFFICRFFVDMASLGMDLLINSPNGANAIGSGDNFGIAGSFALQIDKNQILNPDKSLNFGYTFVAGIFSLLEFVGAIIILILAFLFFLRNYVIYFLVALSPIAFMVAGIPMAKTVWNQWWTNFTKWTFMPIVSLFWLWVGGLWLGNFRELSGSSNGGWILSVLFAGVCFYLAITSPLKMGGSIMQGWNKLGKQAWGLTGGNAAAYGKRKAGLWYESQGENGKWYNPLGHIARFGANSRMAKEFDEKRLKDIQENTRARIREKSRSGRARTISEEKFGGAEEKAKSRVMAGYVKTKAGEKWAEKRAEWLEEKAIAEADLKRGLAKGTTNFASSEEGQKLMVQRERINQEALTYEDQLKGLQTETTIKFLNGLDEFKNDKKLLDDRVLAMTRNLWLGEALNKSQQDRVDEVMQSQMHLHNMSEEIASINTEIENVDKRVLNRINDDMAEIQSKIQNGTATIGEKLRLTDLGFELEKAQSGKVNLIARRDEINSAAKTYYEQEKQAGRGAPIEGMVDLETADSTKVVKGFKGLAEAQGFPADMGGLIMTRTGKLTSIQVKGDIDKYLGEKTVDEIADDLNPDRMSSLVKGKMVLAEIGQDGKPINDHHAVIANYREGRRYLNHPSANREIEGRMLALAQVAKRTSDADSPTAAASLATMMSDQAAVQARNVFNDQITRAARNMTGNTKEKYLKNMIGGAATTLEIREALESHMIARGPMSRLAYSSVMRQPSMGASNNPGNYLSSAQSEGGAGYHPVGQSSSTENSPNVVKSVVAAVRANPDISYSKLSKTLGEGLKDVARSTDDIKTSLLQSRTHFATDLSKQMGINLRQELRPAFAKALANLPQNASAAQIASKVQEIVPGSQPKIDSDKIGQILAQAKSYSGTEKAIDLLSQTQNIADHQTFVQHFSQMTPAQAQSQLQVLTRARQQVENIDVPTTEMLGAVTAALQKTGFAPSQGELISESKAIDSLFMAQQAAQASVKAFDQTGKFDIDKANDSLANQFINPEQSGNASPLSDSPGLHRDIVPPTSSPAPDTGRQ